MIRTDGKQTIANDPGRKPRASMQEQIEQVHYEQTQRKLARLEARVLFLERERDDQERRNA